MSLPRPPRSRSPWILTRLDAFDNAFRAGFEDYIADWQGILTPETLTALKEHPGNEAEFPAVPVALWARLALSLPPCLTRVRVIPTR